MTNDDNVQGGAPLASEGQPLDVAASTSEAQHAPVATEVQPDLHLERRPRLEALWFQLSDPFLPTALIPVPTVRGSEALAVALAVAEVGASISKIPVLVWNALGLMPAEAVSVADELTDVSRPSLIVVDAPTANAGAIPILRACPRSVLVVGLTRSRADQVEEILATVGIDRVLGSLCIDEERSRKRR